MTVQKHGRWFLFCLNFTFVSWGVLFLIGVTHGVFRRELQGQMSLRIIFGAANVLHFAALLLLLTAIYNGLAYLIRRQFANRRARGRIEGMRSGGRTISDEERRLVYQEEYRRERKGRKQVAQAA